MPSEQECGSGNVSDGHACSNTHTHCHFHLAFYLCPTQGQALTALAPR